MTKLIYVSNGSLDGYTEDEHGSFDWTAPDELFAFITDLVRLVGTYLYGRRSGIPPLKRAIIGGWCKATCGSA